jgi:glycosyltransferase involved in cell wall biosynthesis
MHFLIDLRNLNCRHCGAHTFSHNVIKHVVNIGKAAGFNKTEYIASSLEQNIFKESRVYLAFFERFHRVFRILDNFLIGLRLLLFTKGPVMYWIPLNTGLPALIRYNSRFTIVTTIHDLKLYDKPDFVPFFNRLYRSFELKECIKASHKITCISNFTSSRLKAHFPQDFNSKPVEVFYEGVSKNIYCYKDIEHLQSKKPFLLTVGVNANKNIGTLLEAYKVMCSEYGYIGNLRIVGKATEQLTKLIGQLGLSRRVEFFDCLKKSELSFFYSNCDAFVFTSVYEGFGLPILEAASHGARILTSNSSSLVEISPDGVFLVDTSSIESISKNMRELLDIPKPINYKLDEFDWKVNSQGLGRFIFSDFLKKN